MTDNLSGLVDEQFCYLMTRGRRTGHPHRIEIWFGLNVRTAYMLSGGGGKSDWVRNIVAEPRVKFRIARREFDAIARIVEDAAEDALSRRLLVEKYQPTYSEDLTEWGRMSLPVAVDLPA